jgi:hypothetical protein
MRAGGSSRPNERDGGNCVSGGEDRSIIERFTASDLLTLRGELLRSGVDSFQAAEIVCSFLSGRGYGVSSQEARGVASRI